MSLQYEWQLKNYSCLHGTQVIRRTLMEKPCSLYPFLEVCANSFEIALDVPTFNSKEEMFVQYSHLESW
jgi:hypothetical protein